MKFLTMAFTGIPENYDVEAYMTRGHARLTVRRRDGRRTLDRRALSLR
jgi:hypothetical protein